VEEMGELIRVRHGIKGKIAIQINDAVIDKDDGHADWLGRTNDIWEVVTILEPSPDMDSSTVIQPEDEPITTTQDVFTPMNSAPIASKRAEVHESISIPESEPEKTEGEPTVTHEGMLTLTNPAPTNSEPTGEPELTSVPGSEPEIPDNGLTILTEDVLTLTNPTPTNPEPAEISETATAQDSEPEELGNPIEATVPIQLESENISPDGTPEEAAHRTRALTDWTEQLHAPKAPKPPTQGKNKPKEIITSESSGSGDGVTPPPPSSTQPEATEHVERVEHEQSEQMKAFAREVLAQEGTTVMTERIEEVIDRVHRQV
jgi:hypothetical protein